MELAMFFDSTAFPIETTISAMTVSELVVISMDFLSSS